MLKWDDNRTKEEHAIASTTSIEDDHAIARPLNTEWTGFQGTETILSRGLVKTSLLANH